MEIKNILYINLTKREDRKIHVEHQLSLIGLSGERFNAIKLKNGRVGCSMSHLKCVELAKERNWDHVFICEDDITFTKPFSIVTSIPNPPNSPLVSVAIFLKLSGLM